MNNIVNLTIQKISDVFTVDAMNMSFFISVKCLSECNTKYIVNAIN